MPDISGQQALDVAIGLVFVFFLLSILCSAINEAIAVLLASRSQGLLKGLRSMLADDGDPPERARQSKLAATDPSAMTQPPEERQAGEPTVAALLDHPLVRSLADETAFRTIRRQVPAYVGSRTFALALLDTVAPDAGRPAKPAEPADGKPAPASAEHDVIAKVHANVMGIRNRHVRTALLAILDDARGDIDRFRGGVEAWFDTTMERVSGWYQRYVQRNLWIIAVAVVLVLNADSYQIASQLWKDDTLRAAAVAQAQKTVAEGNTTDIPDATADETAVADPAPEAAQTPTEALADVQELQLPIGWSTDKDDPRLPDDTKGWFLKLVGLAVTVIALSLGAPFWFDALNKVSRIRGGGKPAQAEPR